MGWGKSKAPKSEDAYKAIKCGDKALLQGLLDKGCDPNNFKDPYTGDVCLHLATNKGKVDIIELLLAKKAQVNLQNTLGQTALHCAAGYNMVGAVEKLLAGGASTTVTDIEGKTPIDMATTYGNSPEVLRLLQQAKN
mmetsp:Transcript_69919/g.116118  ORF Transcript_69919/g.116118 Transcript_69919/m.116118 type:complete len:137 (-) Transcript_69919:296-706(-)|eukprot:CAMPEP_0119317666 /NCGR_PEP_ID=MMETSP1333-20130426/43830_1 /TAXON_ID=418940 /ORGANISM="Scyphosphaera apsteinii, Strain RCC1455" /LENGTH=136 /DNA_ID=CAMNT_0007323665 /DNA_START=85 /DNA_END=495 /DNA_ORIENTATION=-